MSELLSLVREYGRACAIEQAWRTANVIHERNFEAGKSPSELLAKIQSTLKEQGQ